MQLKFTILLLILVFLLITFYSPIEIIAEIYVSTNGNDSYGDGTISKPFMTIHRGVKEAVISGDNRVHISEGIYTEHVVLSNGISLLGGFSSTFTSRDTNLINYRTKIHGTGNGRCILAKNITDETIIEGLIMSNGYLAGLGNDGAGIHCTNCNNNLIIKNNEIKNNKSRDSYGGGIYLWYSSPKIFNNKIIDNSAIYGGGIYLTSSLSKISNNIINNNNSYFGGGLYVYNGKPEICNNTINNNFNTGYGNSHGGGMFVYGSSPKITNNKIENNRSGAYCFGGGIYLENGSAVIDNNKIIKNNAWLGSGLYLRNSLIEICNNIINSNIGDVGSGLFVENNTPKEIIIHDNIINYNKGTYDAGLFLSSSIATIFNNIINSNTAADGNCGLGVANSSSAIIYNNRIINNISWIYAGLGLFQNSSADIYNNVINNNSARDCGSGLNIINFSRAKVINNTITDNSNNVIYLKNNSSITMINNIIAGENAKVGVYEADLSSDVSVLSNNCFYGMQDKYYYYDYAEGYKTNATEINAMSGAGGNIAVDPLMENDNIHLQTNSPCIGAGIDPTFYINSLTNDIDGNKRPYPEEGDYDIGAVERAEVLIKLIYPENEEVISDTTMPVFKWEIPAEENKKNLHFQINISVEGNILYSFESKTDPIGFTPLLPIQEGVGNQFYTMLKALQPGTYSWQVSAWNGRDYYINSPVWEFTIQQP